MKNNQVIKNETISFNSFGINKKPIEKRPLLSATIRNEKDIKKRILERPTINYYAAIIFIAVHLISAVLLTYIVEFVLKEAKIVLNIKTILLYCMIVALEFCITMRYTLVWLVKIYQRYARAEIRLRCCMTPSCSEYAIIALKKYGVIRGIIKTIKRLKRCHPPGKIDYP